ncbi:MAG: type II secretion system protein GspD [Planctomycetes bacterium]|nr:type II secretion system protein GspD [Planctomycetota bacterium]
MKLTTRQKLIFIASISLTLVFGGITVGGEDVDGQTPISVHNVWVDVPLGQVFRDISIETGVIIATCPHMPDPLVSLDAGLGKDLDVCLGELITGQGLFVNQRSKRFYLISGGDPLCPSALETATSKRIDLKYITARHLQSSIPKSMEKYITTGERMNEIFVYALPEISSHVMDLVRKLDIPRQQVMLEVLVVDIWEDTTDKLGLNWDFSSPHTAFNTLDGAGSFTGLGSYASIAASNLTQLSLTLNALISEKRASIRSRPRVATLNGEKASIDISLDEYFSIATDVYGGSLRTKLEVIKSGVLLEITPHIGDDGDITVDVMTEVSDVASRQNTATGQSGASGDLPVIRRRKANTRVRVKEGDAIVIGGLIEVQETTDRKKVPFLGSLPIVGGLFTSKEDRTSKKEVMIFITPRIMQEGTIAVSDRHELIDEVQEAEELRDVATFFDVRNYKGHADVKKVSGESETVDYYSDEFVSALEIQEQADDEAAESRSDGLLDPDEERKMLLEAIALLDTEK